jgi:hypothetical protein
MPGKGEPKLTNEARAFVVQALACFDSLSSVVAAVQAEFGVKIAPQSVEAYDPTKRAGRNLHPKWRTLFEETRAAFRENTSGIGIANRAVRLRRLDRMAEKAETMGNIALAAQLHEQAAKEVGDVFTNRHKVEHAGGVAITVAPDDAAL